MQFVLNVDLLDCEARLAKNSLATVEFEVTPVVVHEEGTEPEHVEKLELVLGDVETLAVVFV